VLDLIRKGVRMIQNVALLKWCRELGIRVSWNLLYAVPGETLDDYEHQIALMRRIPQLMPPTSVSRVRIDRFSPYFQRYADFGWSSIRPLDLYAELHPTTSASGVHDLAYHFDGEGGTLDPRPYERELYRAASDWQAMHKRGDGLFWDKTLGLFEIRGQEVQAYEPSDTLAELLRLTHVPTGISRVRAEVDVSDADWQALIDNGVLLCEGNQVLNLAIRLDHDGADQDRDSVDSALRILAVQ
jgi:hypothetical protein